MPPRPNYWKRWLKRQRKHLFITKCLPFRGNFVFVLFFLKNVKKENIAGGRGKMAVMMSSMMVKSLLSLLLNNEQHSTKWTAQVENNWKGVKYKLNQIMFMKGFVLLFLTLIRQHLSKDNREVYETEMSQITLTLRLCCLWHFSLIHFTWYFNPGGCQFKATFKGEIGFVNIYRGGGAALSL